MQRIIAVTALTLPLLLGAQAQAKGCLKGAAVGAIAGHYMHHHAVLGAIGGCVVGRHLAADKARQDEYNRTHPHSGPH
jgi:outer membrane lipoprotein SlyB